MRTNTHPDPDQALWASLPEELAKKIAHHALEAWASDIVRYDTLKRDGWAMAHLNQTFFRTFLPMRLIMRHGPDHPKRAFCLVEGVLRFLHSEPRILIGTFAYSLMYCEVYKTCRRRGCRCGREDDADRHRRNYKRAWKTVNCVCAQKSMIHALTYWLIHLYTSGQLPKPTGWQRARIVHFLYHVFHYVDRYHIDHLNLPSVRQHVEQAYAVVDALC